MISFLTKGKSIIAGVILASALCGQSTHANPLKRYKATAAISILATGGIGYTVWSAYKKACKDDKKRVEKEGGERKVTSFVKFITTPELCGEYLPMPTIGLALAALGLAVVVERNKNARADAAEAQRKFDGTEEAVLEKVCTDLIEEELAARAAKQQENITRGTSEELPPLSATPLTLIEWWNTGFNDQQKLNLNTLKNKYISEYVTGLITGIEQDIEELDKMTRAAQDSRHDTMQDQPLTRGYSTVTPQLADELGNLDLPEYASYKGQLERLDARYKQAVQNYCAACIRNCIVGEKFQQTPQDLENSLLNRIGLQNNAERVFDVTAYTQARREHINTKVQEKIDEARRDLETHWGLIWSVPSVHDASRRALLNDNDLAPALNEKIRTDYGIQATSSWGKITKGLDSYAKELQSYYKTIDALSTELGGWLILAPEIKDAINQTVRTPELPETAGSRLCDALMKSVCCNNVWRDIGGAASRFRSLDSIPAKLAFLPDLFDALNEFNQKCEAGSTDENKQRLTLLECAELNGGVAPQQSSTQHKLHALATSGVVTFGFIQGKLFNFFGTDKQVLCVTFRSSSGEDWYAYTAKDGALGWNVQRGVLGNLAERAAQTAVGQAVANSGLGQAAGQAAQAGGEILSRAWSFITGS